MANIGYLRNNLRLAYRHAWEKLSKRRGKTVQKLPLNLTIASIIAFKAPYTVVVLLSEWRSFVLMFVYFILNKYFSLWYIVFADNKLHFHVWQEINIITSQ